MHDDQQHPGSAMRLQPGEIDRDISTMDYEQITAYRQRLMAVRDAATDALAAINTQLGGARSRVYTHGEYADPTWFRRAERARAAKEQAVRALNRRLQDVDWRRGHLRRTQAQGRHEARQRDQDALFVRVAGDVLDRATYMRIWNLVERQLETEEEER
jgi:hypothetical protein